MKKIYLTVLLLIVCFVSRAQVTLPYAYDFAGGTFGNSGWGIESSDQSCLNTSLSGPQNSDETFWFVSGWQDCGQQFRLYLISPRLINSTEDSVQFSFRYIAPRRTPSVDNVETFVVGYCLADIVDTIEDFVWLEDTVTCTNHETWEIYRRNLPANTQFVAIAYTSGKQWALKVDDILIRPDSPDATHLFTVNANEGGTVAVTADGVTTYGTTVVPEGVELTYTVTADPGCYISDFRRDGRVNYSAVDETSFTETLYPIISDHVVDVTFGHYVYTIQVLAGEHGHIVPDGGSSHALTVPWDTTIGFRIYPDEGYHISQVALTSGTTTTYLYDCPDTLTLPNIRKNYRVQVSFALNDYVVHVSAGAGGTVSPSGDVNVEGLTSPEFRITANPGYLIDTIYIDGTPVDLPHYAAYVYTFHQITSDHSLHATFLHQPYIVHYTSGEHGTMTAQGGTTVGLDSLQIYYEDTIVFHFFIEEGYELSDIQLNGESIGVGNPYLLTHVTQNSLFHAVFAEKRFQVTSYIHGAGSVTPQQSASVGYFDTLRLVVAPDNCMQTDQLLLDGLPIALTDTLELTHLEGSHTVDAYFVQKYYTMEILPCSHGALAGSPEVMCGGTSYVKIVPDHCYRFSHFYMDGVERADLLHQIYDTLWAYVPSVDANHTFFADFEMITYDVTVQTQGAGTVTPSVVGSVVCDTTLSFEIIPDECHYVASVQVNGQIVDSARRYPCANSGFGDTLRFHLSQVEQDMNVSVEFRRFEFPLTLTAGAHGSLSETGTLQLPCGTDTVITITPDACFEIASVRVDGEEVTSSLHYNGTAATYTFANVHAAHSLEATFTRQTYTVETVVAPHGSLLPGNDSVVLCGNDMTFVVVPDECYQIDNVWLDGTPVNAQLVYRPNVSRTTGDSATFVLSNITADHVVSVAFKPIVYDMLALAFEADYGTVSFSEPGTSIACGSSVTLTMTPEDCYHIQEVWYNGYLNTDYQVDENGVGTLVFPSVMNNVYMSVIYERNSYSLALAQPTQHGSITYPTDAQTCGDAVQLTYRADDCYHLDSVMVGDEWIPVSELSEEADGFVYVIQNLHSDLQLDAAFSIDSVRFVNSGNVPLSVTDSVLACGQSLTVFSVREDCKQLDSIRITGTMYTVSNIDGNRMRLVGDTLFVRFEDIHEDCDLAVFYSQRQYEVNAEVQGLGQISCPSHQTVSCGDSILIAITPDDCQHFEYATVNSAVYPVTNDTLIIRNIRSNLNIVFLFAPDMYVMATESNALGEIQGESGPVACGTDLQYVFQPADCAMLDSVFLNGTCVNDRIVNSPLPTLQLDSISVDYNIRAVFKKIPYQVEIETDIADFVSLGAHNNVACGDNLSVTITPDHCHYLSEILLNGQSVMSEMVEEGSSFHLSLSNIRQDYRLEIFFAKRNHQVVTLLMDAEHHLLSREEYEIVCGNDTTLAVVPYSDCYSIDSVYLQGSIVALQPSYFLHDVEEDVAMTVFMHKVSYTVEVQGNGHFTMTEGDVTQTLFCGDTLRLGFAPDEGYYLSQLVVDNDTITASDHYIFENIHSGHLVKVLTELYYYQVVTTTNGFGAATPDSVVAGYGSDVTVRLVPNDCHELRAVTVDGADCFDSLQFYDGYAELTLHALTADKAVTATFGLMGYVCSVSGNVGGSLQPSATALMCGDTLDVAIMPAACYHVDSVWVNDVFVPQEQLQQLGDELHYRVESVRKDYRVEARFERNDYTVTVENHGAGTVVTSASQVLCGDGFSFYIAPAPCTQLHSVLLNGEDITARLTYRNNVNPWLADTACFAVTDVTENQTVAVSYVSDGARHIDLTFQSGTNVLRNETVNVVCGGDTALPLTFDCYTIDSVFVDGARIPTVDTCRFSEVIADHSVLVILSRTHYPIEAQSSPHGTITPSGTTMVACGERVTLNIHPDDCYSVDSVLVNGVNVGAVTSYDIEHVFESQFVKAYFSVKEYRVEVVAADHGTVTNAGMNVVQCGETFAIVITPDDCYDIGSVRVDGLSSNSQLHGDTLYLNNVGDNHIVSVEFDLHHYAQYTENNPGGSISPSFIAAACGSEQTFVVDPIDCYRVDTVWINGVALSRDSLTFNDDIASFTLYNIRQENRIRVKFTGISYQFNVENNGNGVVNLENSIDCNGASTFYIIPAQCTQISSAVLNGVNITDSLVMHPNVNPLLPDTAFYTIVQMDEDKLLQIHYQSLPDNQVHISYTDGTNDLYAVDSVLNCGGSLSLSIAYDCYVVDSVLVNDENVGALSQISVPSNLVDQTVRAFFSQKRHNVQLVAGEGGSIAPLGDTLVYCGDTLSVAITPDDCFDIESVTVDGAEIGAVTTYQLENVTAAHTVRASFVQKTFTLTPLASTGGSITPNVTTTVPCDSTFTFTFEPNEGYSIDAVVVDGDTAAAASSYTFAHVTGNHTVKPVFVRNRYVITATAGAGGSVTPESSIVEYGGRQTITITPEDCYHIDSIFADGAYVGQYPTYTFTNVTGEHWLDAKFARDEFNITASVEGEGSITPSGTTTVDCGEQVTYSIVPEAGWHLTSLLVDGTPVDSIETYTFTDVRDHHTITAQFAINEFRVTAMAADGGSVTPSDTTVNYHESVTVAITAADCHHIDSVFADDSYVGDVTSYTFDNMEDNHVLNATFVLNEYEITAVQGEHGTITPSGTTTVDCGEQVTYSIVPEAGWHLTSLLVDGTPVDSIETYTFTDVRDHHTITAQFAINEFSVTAMAAAGGSVSPSLVEAFYGEDVTVGIIPDDCYSIDSVFVDGRYVGRVSSYLFENIDSNHTLYATFAVNEYTVAVNNGTGGEARATATRVLCGGEYSVLIVPDTCRTLERVEVNGTDVTPQLFYRESASRWLPDTAVFTMVNVREDQEVVVVYGTEEARHIAISFLSGTNVLAYEDVVLPCGGETVLPIAHDCYTVDSVLLDGVRVEVAGELRLTEVIADHTVQVMLSRTQYQITAQGSSHGTITPSGTTVVPCGTDKTYSIVPETGYYIDTLIVDDTIRANSTSYTFSNVRENHTIRVVFAQHSYWVDVEVSGNGLVQPGDTLVWHGDAVHFDIVPGDCQTVDSVVVDGENRGSVTEYDFAAVTGPHSLHAYFSQRQYSVMAGVSENGSISFSNSEVLCGDSVSFTVSPNACYKLDSVRVNGVNVGAVTSDTIRNIRQNLVVDAFFSQIAYTVSVDENVQHGTITANAAEVLCGESVTLTIQPDDCYSIDSVWVNGVNLGTENSFIISNIVENKYVTAFFSIKELTVEVTSEGHGTVTNLGTNTVTCGNDFSVILTPDECYEIGEIRVDGVMANNRLQGNMLTLDNVTGNHTVSVTFEQIHYVQTAICNVGGTVSPASVSAACGGEVTYTIHPISCYRIDTVWLNGTLLPRDSLTFDGFDATFTMRNIRQINTVQVRFTGVSYQFNVENNGNGLVRLEQNSFDCDGEATFFILPAPCTRISSVVLNGVNLTDSLVMHPNINPLLPDTAFYTIARMNEDKLLKINYQNLPDNLVHILYTDGSNNLSVADSVLACGELLSLSIGYDCYVVDSVLVNSENVGAVTSLSLPSNLEDQSVTAYFSRSRFDISATAGEGGTIAFPNGTSAYCGDTLSCTIVPNDCHSIDSVVVNGVNLGVISEYDFENITENQNVRVYFSRNEFVVSTRTEGNGQIMLDGSATVLCGDTVHCSILPAECHAIDSVVVNGENKGAISVYDFENIVRNQEIIAFFSQKEYSFVASAENGGQIEPAGTTTVACGEQQTYTILPGSCYSIDSVVVNGVNMGTETTYTLMAMESAGNQTIRAYFSQNRYNVRLEAGVGGRITPNGDTSVPCGETLTVTITPDECYDIESVTVDGTEVGAVETYLLTDVTGPHTVRATFVQKNYTLTPLASTGGSIRPNVTTTVECGSDFAFRFTPNAGYYVSGVVVDGDTLAGDTIYTFQNVTTHHSVQPLFSLSHFVITATAGEGGSVSPTYSVVNYRGRQTVSITAAPCHRIDSVFVDNVYVGDRASFTFNNVVADHTLRAVFAMNEYRLTASVEGSGTITPSGDTIVACGESVTYTATPEAGWRLTALIVDGVRRPAASSYTFSNIRDHHSITAQFSVIEYQVTATAGDGGSVTPTDTAVPEGGSVTVSILPDDCYQVAAVLVDGTNVGAVRSYTFDNVNDDHTLSATFAHTEYTIAVLPAPQHGTITPANMTTVSCGDSIRYSITPDEGYHVAELIVDGVAMGATETYLFTEVHANHRITAQFAINEYRVTATAGDGGSVTPTDTTVTYGEPVTVNIIPNECYYVDSVFVDEVFVGSDNFYTFANVTDSHTVRATFAMYEYEITASVEGSGTITPSGDTIVACGESVTYTATPEAGWRLTALIVDGVRRPAASSYTFSNIRDHHSITAQFSVIEYRVTATAGEGGSVTPTDTTVAYGESVTLNFIPDDCYDIESLIVDGIDGDYTTSYTFSNISDDHTVKVTFMRYEFILVPQASAGGTITPNEMDIVECGSDYTFHFTPDEGYSISALIVDEVLHAADTVYTFENIRDNHTISAQFTLNEYRVTATAGDGGSVTPTDTTVTYGEPVTVNILPNECYYIDSVFVDEVFVGSDNFYTFANVTDSHTVRATFAMYEYEITASVEGNGTITPSGTMTVPCGSEVTYTFAPATGWHLTGLLVDNTPVDSTETYTFTNIGDNHTILAQFAIDEFTVTATAGEGGSVTPTDTTVTYGGSATITITPADCHHIDSVLVNSANVGAVTSYVISDITENQVVEAFFTQDFYDVFVAVSNENELIFFDTIHMPCGSDTLVEVPLFDCYHVDSIVVNEVRMEQIETVRLVDIQENKNVIFYLSREEFVIVASKQGNGTISPSDTTHLLCDSQITFTFTPDEGWYVENLIVDGDSLGTPTSNHYTFVNINANHTIEVIFAQTMFVITSSIDPVDAGHITPYGSTFVNYGDNQTYNISPFPGYQVIDVEVDGVSQGAITTYTFYNVTANHTIVAHLMTVGVEEAAVNEEIVVWPNPVENVCHVRIPNEHNAEIQLFDAQGKLILRKQADADEVEIDFVGRPSGMYMLRIVSDGNVVATRKVIRK